MFCFKSHGLLNLMLDFSKASCSILGLQSFPLLRALLFFYYSTSAAIVPSTVRLSYVALLTTHTYLHRRDRPSIAIVCFYCCCCCCWIEREIFHVPRNSIFIIIHQQQQFSPVGELNHSLVYVIHPPTPHLRSNFADYCVLRHRDRQTGWRIDIRLPERL